MIGTIPTVSVLGVSVCKLTRDQAIEAVGRLAAEESCQMLAYVNAHTLNLAVHDDVLRAALNRSALVMNDGFGLNLAAKLRGECFPENLNGSDFTLRLLELAATNGWGVFFLGGEPGVAEEAAHRLQGRIANLHIVGVCHGFTNESDESLVRRVKDAGTAMLLVALGSPQQETWIDRNLGATGALIGVGVGAFFDFSAGKVVRAPRWMNILGIEWCFRLMQEPRRLWRRYIVGNPLFLLRAWRDRRRPSRSGGSGQDEQERQAQALVAQHGHAVPPLPESDPR